MWRLCQKTRINIKRGAIGRLDQLLRNVILTTSFNVTVEEPGPGGDPGVPVLPAGCLEAYIYTEPSSYALKVIRKFFLNHNKSFRWHLGDYEKHIFFNLKACERRNFEFCVFLRMSSVTVTLHLD